MLSPCSLYPTVRRAEYADLRGQPADLLISTEIIIEQS
jgi:hypothetical protein